MELARSRNCTLPVHIDDQLLAECHEAILKIASLPLGQRLRVSAYTLPADHSMNSMTHNTTHTIASAQLLPTKDLALC
jgi:hypothetical protein